MIKQIAAKNGHKPGLTLKKTSPHKTPFKFELILVITAIIYKLKTQKAL